jgi:hypothetical protein
VAAYTNSSLTIGKAYYYKLRAYRTVNGIKMYSGYSGAVSAKPVLAVLAGVKAARASSTSIKVSWTKGTEASGYEVYYFLSIQMKLSPLEIVQGLNLILKIKVFFSSSSGRKGARLLSVFKKTLSEASCFEKGCSAKVRR